MNDELVLYRLTDDGVAVLTLNRPDRMNGWTDQMGEQYFSLLAACASNPAVKVIVVTGAGRAWCAGADMGSLSALSGAGGANPSTVAREPTAERPAPNHHWFTTTVPKPVIAAINGACAGMGFAQALMCDVRFAAAGAKLTTSFSQRGLIAEWGLSWTLPRVVGTGHAMDLLLSGRVVLADEALRIGLVNQVFAAETFLDEVMAYATTLATTASPASWAVMKAQIYGDYTRTLPEAEAQAVLLMASSFTRPDFKEGVSSFMEKRPPNFAGLAATPAKQ
jgi:enoyl-CoA hydratase/carnithine racemase